MNAGLDFETKILVKHDAPDLLRSELARDDWQGELIAMSGVTDCYQPAEREFRLTRGCLEVMLEARQPVGIVTKNALVTRDLDLLAPLASENLAHVYVSVTTLDANLARTMEPRTATPEARLRAIRELSAAGVPVGVMVAPIIPGINDSEVPAILQAARAARRTDGRLYVGAAAAGRAAGFRRMADAQLSGQGRAGLFADSLHARGPHERRAVRNSHARPRQLRGWNRPHVPGIQGQVRVGSRIAAAGQLEIRRAPAGARTNAVVLTNRAVSLAASISPRSPGLD